MSCELTVIHKKKQERRRKKEKAGLNAIATITEKLASCTFTM